MGRAVVLLLWVWPAACLAAETLRILVDELEQVVEVRGASLGYGPDAEEGPFTALPEGSVEVRRARGLLWVGEVPVVGRQVRVRAGELSSERVGRGELRVGAHRVRGDVVIRERGERLQVINVLDLEDYLAGVLAGEMPPTFPDEALKAQAVAARTYALHKKLAAYDAPYHLGSSVLHQVYRGLAASDARLRRLVEATRGQVLTYDLAPIEAYFHASCGGRTESGAAALQRSLPYLQPVECPCAKTPSSRWTVRLRGAELQRALRTGRRPPRVEVVDRSATGRVAHLRVGEDTLDGAAFRRRLGYDRLRSLDFELAEDGEDGIRVTGRGHGHGAGLCQWGAKVLAQQGWTYEQILLHYYPGTELQPLF